MHETAYEHGRRFFATYWDPRFTDVVELGSQDVNGTLRDHCPPGARYLGLDMIEAKGVDMVIIPGAPIPLPDESADVIVTSSAFEHDVCFWSTFLDLVRLLKPGGLLYVNAPSNNDVHRYPVDCWRFYPDAGIGLVEWARRSDVRVELIESFVARAKASGWCDFVAVFRKPGPALHRTGRMADSDDSQNAYDYEADRFERESARTFDMIASDQLKEQVRRLTGERLEDARHIEQQRSEIARLVRTMDEARASTDGQVSAITGELNREIARLRGEVEALRTSTSWRITGPLRAIASVFRAS